MSGSNKLEDANRLLKLKLMRVVDCFGHEAHHRLFKQ
jgi:hypothetical protein